MAFEAGRVTIGELVGSHSNAQLRIPYYQRGYSWGADQVETLLADVLSFAETRSKGRDDEYFLGPIVLMNGPPHERYQFVIDGQQRLASVQIFLACLRDIAHELGDIDESSLELARQIQADAFSSSGPGGGPRSPLRLGDLDQKFFENEIQKYPRTTQRVPRNESEGRILKARNVLRKGLELWVGERQNQTSTMSSLYELVVQRLILVAIDVDNDRQAMDVFERINCRGADLAETDLILHRIMSRCGTQKERKRVRESWNRIGAELGNVASIQQFLRHMWIAKIGNTASQKLYDLTAKHLDGSNVRPDEFVDDCLTFSEEYVFLLTQQSLTLHHESRDAVWAIVHHLGTRDALPLLLAAYRRFGKSPSFSTVAKATEALIVRYSVFAELDSSELRGVLFDACSEVGTAREDDQAVAQVLAKLRTVNPTSEQIRAGVRRERKFSRKIALYVLREIQNQSVDGAYKSTATLEHIFPQKPSQGYSPDRKRLLKPFLNHIGNLTLLTDRDNKKASNRPYGEKKKLIYRSAELEIARQVATYEKWGLKSIKDRADMLAVAASKRWQL